MQMHSHETLMQNVDTLLKPGGRCIVGDIMEGSSLARHFDEVVTHKCLTGHANVTWWSDERLERLIRGTNLELVRTELITTHTWNFASESQMALFFKALHASMIPFTA